ncbi:hypothetical protein BGW39_005033 [Mortierella sp. 14UC]|nr:hypothetical protein BGW39_005033 [Mortierella sp. 14UC]
MPSTACAKFFEVPELVEQLSLFLRPHDLAQVLQTRRDIYNAAIHVFWRHIDMEDDHRVDRLVSTPEALGALKKYTPFVHSLKAGFIFMSYSFEGVMRFLDEQQEDKKGMWDTTTTQPTTDSNASCIQRPPWLPRPTMRNDRACTLPPMAQLTHLDVCFDRQYRGVLFDNAMLKNKAVRLLCPLTWLMNFNAARMTHVTLRFMDPPEALELRCLARSLSKLTKLTHLRIDMLLPGANCVPWLLISMVPILFFALPQSVVSVEMEANARDQVMEDRFERGLRTVYGGSTGDKEDEEDEEQSLDWEEGDLVERKEPLENLKVLILPSTYKGYSAGQIGRIMRHCPALESWDIPTFRNDEAANVLFQTIRAVVHQQGTVVQESKFLHHLTAKRPTELCRGEDWAQIMDALPEQRVESVEFYCHLNANPEKFVPALLRHSEVLRSVMFKDMYRVESRTIATILTQCCGLETFWATMSKENFGQGFVELELSHAVGKEWACTRIKDLRFTVNLAAHQYSGASGVSVDQQQRWHYVKLGAFYEQLGKFTELEELEIFVSPPPMGSSTTTSSSFHGYTNARSYFFRSLAGLLSLEEEDSETGKRGFLSLLAGLKKLRVLQGSFRAGTVETIETFGQRETEWMVENWPALEKIELLPERYESLEMFKMPKHVAWLHQRRPELKLCR